MPLSVGLSLSPSRNRGASEPCTHVTNRESVDVYADRIDVAGLEEYPRVFFLPFWKKVEAIHPKVMGDTGARSVIVLDLDEVASAAAGGGSGGAAVGESILLSAAGILALWYGVRTSIEEIFEAGEEFDELSVEKKELLNEAVEALTKGMSSESLKRLQENLSAMLIENKSRRHAATVNGVFGGVVSGVGATGISVGTFLSLPVYESAAAAAAGVTVLAVAAPVVSVFATGIAAQQAYRCFKTKKVMKALDRVSGESLSKDEEAVYALLKDRIKLIRKVSVARSASMVCMAVGAPLTVFGGPYGLAVLLPGVLGSIIAGYIDSRKLGYSPQLTWEDKALIDGKEALVNAIDGAHKEYVQLKKLKNEHRLLYPIGGQAPLPFKAGAKAIAWVRRKLKNEDLAYPPAEKTFFKFLSERGVLEKTNKVNALNRVELEYKNLLAQVPANCEWTTDQLLRKSELENARDVMDREYEELLEEERLLNRALQAPIPVSESIFCMVRYMIKNNLFPNLSERLMGDKRIKKTLMEHSVITKDGKEFHLDANALVLLMAEGSPLSLKEKTRLLEAIFEKARDTLFITAKNRARWRERQLLDFLAVHLVQSDKTASFD